MSYGNGYGNNRGGYGNRGGGYSGGGGNRSQGGGTMQKKPNVTYLKHNEQKNRPEDSDMWGSVVFDFDIKAGDKVNISFYSNEGKGWGPKLLFRQPKDQGGQQGGGGGYGQRGNGGYQRQQQAPQQQGMYDNGPDLNDDVPF